MSMVITDEQFTTIEYYLRELRDGNAHHIMESRRHHDTLVKFMASLRGQPAPHPESDEAIIRRNLMIWSGSTLP